MHDLGCEANLNNAKTVYLIKKKYAHINTGSSGGYLVNENGEIYGIKAYGVINKGRFYGTLDTINDYYWGGYIAVKIVQNDRGFMS